MRQKQVARGENWGKLLSTSIDVRTVDGDGNALAQGVAILANKGRVLAQRVSLLVLGRDLASLNEGDVEVEAVGLGDSLDGGGTRLVLQDDKSEQPVQRRCYSDEGERLTAVVKRVPKAILTDA